MQLDASATTTARRTVTPPTSQLEATVEGHNDAQAAGLDDPVGKSAEHCAPIAQPPFYAIRCGVDAPLFPTPCMTLGGLATDAVSAEVLRADGSRIRGLYAAGRCAAGVSSYFYVSGLSIADCIHAGRHAAARAQSAT